MLTTARSCVINRYVAVLLLKPLQQIQILRLNRNIKCRHPRLVTDDKLQVDAQRTRDADTLAAAAVEFMRVGVDEALLTGRQSPSAGRHAPRVPAAYLRDECSAVTMMVSKVVMRGFRGKRVLKRSSGSAFCMPLPLPWTSFRDILSVKQNFAARRLQQHGSSLPLWIFRSRISDNADRAAARNGENRRRQRREARLRAEKIFFKSRRGPVSSLIFYDLLHIQRSS